MLAGKMLVEQITVHGGHLAVRFSRTEQIDVLITGQDADTAILDQLRAKGVKVILV